MQIAIAHVLLALDGLLPGMGPALAGPPIFAIALKLQRKD